MSCECPTTVYTAIPGATGTQGPAGAPSTVPGPQGPAGPPGSDGIDAAGSPGADGSNGVSSFTVTTANFTQPAVGLTANVAVASSSWISVGQPLFMQIGGSYLVTAVPDSTHVTLENLGYVSNETAGNNVTTGKVVSPSGFKGDTGPVSTGSRNVVAITEEMATGVAPAAMVFAAPGTWTQKTLNTLYNPDGVATLAANQFTLTAGRWSVVASFCADKCKIRFRLYDVTNATMRLITLNTVTAASGMATMFGAVDVPAGLPVMEIEYQAIDNGGGVFGVPTGIPTELEAYSSLYFTQITFGVGGGGAGDVAAEGLNYCLSGTAPNQMLKIKNLDTGLANRIDTSGADGSTTMDFSNGTAC